MKYVTYANSKLGGPEATGLFLRVAKYPVEAGRVPAPALIQMKAEIETALEVLNNVMLNWTVILSLMMTMYSCSL